MQQRATKVNASEETIKVGLLGIRFLLTGDDSNGSASVFEVLVPVGQKLAAPAHKNDAYASIIFARSGGLPAAALITSAASRKYSGPMIAGDMTASCFTRGDPLRYRGRPYLDGCDGTPIEVGPGQALCIPRGTVHRFDNLGNEDEVVTPDARFHELEEIGYPRGPEGFKVFRRQVNAAIPDEHIFVTVVRFEGDDIIEADLDISATHTGADFMGIPATGRKIRFDVQARGRFVDDKMAERWDRADFENIKRQLTGPTQ